ncbi:hypothetical protein COU60_04850 [Candidatus Pacearchaeota archaeon CG10_big_fil_rev_8_21_14_0_10_34_76]|nr:MAG: hypothetical protein COU60_04850 [Candidatus Pacearchaeota archaeon CG10_big_fil_rev_8_21_14_0_10_34_76]
MDFGEENGIYFLGGRELRVEHSERAIMNYLSQLHENSKIRLHNGFREHHPHDESHRHYTGASKGLTYGLLTEIRELSNT